LLVYFTKSHLLRQEITKMAQCLHRRKLPIWWTGLELIKKPYLRFVLLINARICQLFLINYILC